MSEQNCSGVVTRREHRFWPTAMCDYPYGHPLVVQDDDIQERAVGPRWCVGRDAEWELQHPLFIGWA